MKPKGIIPGITALCAILGMLIGVQYNTVRSQAASAAGTDNVRLTELSAELRKEREEREALEKQLDKQAELLETYEAGESDGAALEFLQKENEKLRAAQGDAGDTGGTSVAGTSLSADVRRAAVIAEVEKTIKEGDKDKHENE